MSNFRLSKNTYYRIQKGKAGVIHNGNITDELALQFLAIKPSRVSLFSKVSDTWQQDIAEYLEDVEAAPKVSQDAPKEDSFVEDEPCSDCEKRKELETLKMYELRELYPDIRETRKAQFIDKVIASEKQA